MSEYDPSGFAAVIVVIILICLVRGIWEYVITPLWRWACHEDKISKQRKHELHVARIYAGHQK